MLTKIAKILVDPRRCQKFKLFSPISPPSPMLVNQSYAFIFSQLEQQVSLKYLAPHSTERPTQLLTPHITGGDDLHGYHSDLVSIQNKIKMVTILKFGFNLPSQSDGD